MSKRRSILRLHLGAVGVAVLVATLPCVAQPSRASEPLQTNALPPPPNGEDARRFLQLAESHGVSVLLPPARPGRREREPRGRILRVDGDGDVTLTNRESDSVVPAPTATAQLGAGGATVGAITTAPTGAVVRSVASRPEFVPDNRPQTQQSQGVALSPPATVAVASRQNVWLDSHRWWLWLMPGLVPVVGIAWLLLGAPFRRE